MARLPLEVIGHHEPTNRRPTLRMRLTLALLVCFAGIYATDTAFAQLNTPREDLYITNGTVRTITESGGTLYIGGSFTSVGPYTGNGVPLDASSGAPVGGFPKVNGTVNTVVSDGSGGWFIGGTFTSVGGVARDRLAHIDATNTVTSWSPGANGTVWDLEVDGGTVYVGGGFTTIGGQSRNQIAALDASTGIPTAWDPNANSTVLDLELSGGTVYVGGYFTTIGGQSRSRIAAVDASTGLATAWDPGANTTVNRLKASGGIVYAAGSFTTIGGQSRSRIAALDATTGSATAWNPNASSTVSDIEVAGGTVYAGGSFTTIGGQSRNRIAALDATTGLATAWDPNASGSVNQLLLSGGILYVGGGFTTIGGQSRNRIAALDASTGLATAWDPNASGYVLALAVSGATVYAGGSFTSLDGQTRNRIAAIDATTGMPTAWDPSANDEVYKLRVSGGLVYAIGAFTTIGGQSRNFIAALDATTGLATSWDPNASSVVNDLEVSGATVYACGRFTSIGGQSRNYIAALDATTGLATAWDPNATGGISGPGGFPITGVIAVAVSGGIVYAGGPFTGIGGQPRNHIAALDATTGLATAWDPNASGSLVSGVGSLEVSGGTVYVGGDFTAIGGQNRNSLAALDATTGLATGWDPDAGFGAVINELKVSGSTVYVAGSFGNVGGQPRNYIAAIDATTGLATAWNPDANYSANALAVTADAVYAGGAFTAIGDGRPYLAGFNFAAPPPALSIDDVALPEGNSGSQTIAFTVTRSGLLDQEVMVDYTTNDGTATTVDNDYVLTTGTLTIPASSASGTIEVPIRGDVVFEGDEVFTVNLSNPVNATIADGSGTGTIQNDDPQPTLSINDVSLAEGDAGTTAFSFSVSLSNPSDQEITVDWATADGSATTANGDYAADSGTLTFPAKTTATQTATVKVNGDVTFEGNETFVVNLSSPSGATISDSQGQGTIQNDDGMPSLSINDVSRAEGDVGTTVFSFPVSLSNPSDQEITVDWATADGTATVANGDYAAASGTLTFPANSTTPKNVPVQVTGDATFEDDETFVVNLSNPTNASIADGQGQGTIQNDDESPSLSIDDVSLAEGDAGTIAFVFDVSLSNLSDQDITVDYATADGSATLADLDYVSASGTLTFPANTTAAQTVTVQVNGDVTLEADEVFVVNLSNPSGATITDSQGEGTILNDDGPPNPSIPTHLLSAIYGDAGDDQYCRGVATDASGSIILTGPFYASLDLGGGALTSAGGADLYLAKLDSSGNHLWSKRFGSSGHQGADFSKVATDPSDNIIITGTFTNAIDFGGGSFNSGSIINTDVYLAKFDPDGNHLWSYGFGANNTDGYTDVATGPTGNIIMAASIEGADLGGGPFVGTIDVASFDPSGAYMWSLDATTGNDATYNATDAVAVDGDGNLIIAGHFRGTADFGGGPLTSATGDEDIFLAKLDANGNHIWSKRFGSLTNARDWASDVCVDDSNNILLVGHSGSSIDLGGGLLSGTWFVAKFDPSGNHVWSRGFHPSDSFVLEAITSNASGDAIITGRFIGSVDLGGGAIDNGGGSFDVLIASYDASGNYISSHGFGDSSPQLGFDLTTDPSGNSILVGDGQGTIDFGGGPLVSAGGIDLFYTKFRCPPSEVALSIDDVTVAEGDAGAVNAVFTVSLSQPAGFDIKVDYQTSDGSATTADTDYVATSGTLTIPALATSGTVTVQVNGDATSEGDETFTVDLSNPINATITDAEGTGTIQNDDGSTDVTDAVVTEFALTGIVPNPMQGRTSIEYTLPREARARLAVLDLQGRTVALLRDGIESPGRHQLSWSGRGERGALPAGMYFLRLEAGGVTATKRMMILR